VTPEDLQQVWTVESMAPGDHLIFAATGISDSPMLPGIQNLPHHSVTHSILMRAKYRTVRRIQAFHDLEHKTIRRRSTNAEAAL
jgi:fructose-1,6-bisphosphatase II